MPIERIQTHDHVSPRVALADDLLAVRDGVYLAEQQLGGAQAALRAETIVVANISAYGDLLNGQKLSSRTHSLNGFHANGHQEGVAVRLNGATDEAIAAMRDQVGRFMSLVTSSPQDLDHAQRMAPYLPSIVLPQEQSTWDALKFAARHYRHERGVDVDEGLEQRLHEARKQLGMIDQRVILAVYDDSSLLERLSVIVEDDITLALADALHNPDAVNAARSAVSDKKIGELKIIPPDARDDQGRPAYHSKYVEEVNRVIATYGLGQKVDEVSSSAVAKQKAYADKVIDTISKSRAQQRAKAELLIASLIDRRNDGQGLSEPQIKRAIDVYNKRKGLDAKVASEQERLNTEIERLRTLYAAIPSHMRGSREDTQVQAYQEAKERLLTENEYKALKQVIEGKDTRQAVYELGEVTYKAEIENAVTNDEIEAQLRWEILQREVRAAGLVPDLVARAVDQSIIEAGIDPASLVKDPSSLTAPHDQVADVAIKRLPVTIEEMIDELPDEAYRTKILTTYAPLVTQSRMTKHAFGVLRDVLPILNDRRAEHPDQEGKLAFAESLLADIAMGSHAGMVMHDNPKDMEILANTLVELQPELQLGAIICPDWGYHKEDDGTVVYHMGELNPGLPATAERVLDYAEILAKRAEELQRPVRFTFNYPAWELTRWGDWLETINGGMSAEDALAMLDNSASLTRERAQLLQNDYFQLDVRVINPADYHDKVAVRIQELLQQESAKVSGVAKARAGFYGNNTHGDVTSEYLAARDIAEAEIGFGLVLPDSDILVVATSPSIARPAMPEETAWIQMVSGYRG